VVLRAFQHSTRNYYRQLKYGVDHLKMNIAKAVSNFALGCTGLSEVYSRRDEYVFSKQNILTGEYEVPEQTLPCTKKMACGLAEAHRLISLCKDPNPNGIIFFISDGKKYEGDFFDGAEDFKSTWPVHTFSLNNITNEYEVGTCLKSINDRHNMCACARLCVCVEDWAIAQLVTFSSVEETILGFDPHRGRTYASHFPLNEKTLIPSRLG
jgi:hypothetical protein